jgi:hypothetical protein
VNGPGNGNGDDLPEPIIEPIRNFAALPEQVRKAVAEGAFLRIRDREPVESAVSVNVLSGVLVHFDRLFRILQAVKSGIEVKRTGRVPEVVGAKHLAAFPAYAGSYALPLRLEAPDGELIGDDRGALESVMQLLSASDEDPLEEHLSNLPERVGDELYALLHELALAEAELTVEEVRDGEGTGEVEISPSSAKSRAAWLTSLVESALASETIFGKLFRIDTKRGRIAIDSQEDDESVIVEANFQPAQLEALRHALNNMVEIEVQVIEEKRPYERTTRNRVMSVVGIREIDPDGPAIEITEAEAPEADAAG